MRYECDRTTVDEKRNWAEHGALWYALQAFCRARHGKRKFGCFVLWLSLIQSDLAWLGSLPHVKIRTVCVFGCVRVCVLVCMRVCVLRACVWLCIFVGKSGGGKKITEWPFYFFNRTVNNAKYENKQ